MGELTSEKENLRKARQYFLDINDGFFNKVKKHVGFQSVNIHRYFIVNN